MSWGCPDIVTYRAGASSGRRSRAVATHSSWQGVDSREYVATTLDRNFDDVGTEEKYPFREVESREEMFEEGGKEEKKTLVWVGL